MASSRYTFTLDLHSTYSQITLPLTAGDTDRELAISFADGDRPYIFEEGDTAEVTLKFPGTGAIRTYSADIPKNDKTHCVFDMSYLTTEPKELEDGSIIYIDKYGSRCPEAGLYDAVVNIYRAGKKIASPFFSLDAVGELTPNDKIPEESIDNLAAILGNATKAIDEIKAVKEDIEEKLANGEFDGKNAYQYAVDGGYKGSEGEFAQKMATPIPTKTSDLVNDSNFLTEHQDLSDYAKKSEIPTKTSDITNDSGFITMSNIPVKSVNGKTGAVELGASDVKARPDTWMPTASEVNADPKGTALSAVSGHNASSDSHNDIRLWIQGLADRINAIANSTDVDLDDFKEVVAYIKDNRGLIDAITTNKINYTDIINDLVTNVTNKPLSAAQGVALKLLIDNLTSNKLDASALTSAINTALAQAKASGEFKGEDGKTPYVGNDGYWYINGTSTGVKAQGNDGKGISSVAKTSTSGLVDTYTITFTDGTKTTYTVTNGKEGTSVTVEDVDETTASGGTNVVTFSDGKAVNIKNGTNGKDGTNYVLTDADRTQIANIVATQLGGQPVYGIVGDDKTVTLRGNIAFDEYTFGYIVNGEFVEIGKGEYEPDEPAAMVNLLDTAYDTDLKTVYNGVGWKANTRMTSGGVEETVGANQKVILTGLIPVGDKGDVFHINGVTHVNYIDGSYSGYTTCFDSSGNFIARLSTSACATYGTDENGDFTITLNHSSLSSGTAYIRFQFGLLKEGATKLYVTRNQLITV